MKNKINFIRIIVFVAVVCLLFIGCGNKGGKLEIKNETDGEIIAIGGTQEEITEKVNSGRIDDFIIVKMYETKTLASISEDGTVYYYWRGIDANKSKTSEDIKSITITKGDTKTITAE